MNSQKNSKESRKDFYDLSIVGQFHSAPKLFGEKAEYPFDQNPEIREIRYQTMERVLNLTSTKEALTSSDGLHLYKTIKAALDTSLNDEAKNDPEEINKLKACKIQIKSYLRNVLNDIQKYIGTIREGDEASKSKNADRTDQAEARRTAAHNRLMSDINTLNRSLIWWFGKNEIDPEDLPPKLKQMYEKQEDKYIGEGVKRIDIGTNGIYPATLNINDRAQITYWALRIYKDLAKLEKKLS